jgi:hypothetical protein
MKVTPKEPIDLYSWLASLPDGLEAFLIIVAVIVSLLILSGIAYLIYYLIKNRTITIGGVEILKKNKTDKLDEPRFHHTCPNRNDIIILFDKIYEVSNYEISLMKLETLREQMDYADFIMANLSTRLKSYYIEELKKRIEPKNITDTDDYQSYEKSLSLFKNRLMNTFRQFCKENHFAEMSMEEFNNYATIKSLYLFHEGSDLLNELYLHQDHITRDELYEINRPHIPEFLVVIKDIIENARKMAIKNKAILKEKKLELATLLESFVGEDNPLLEIWKKQHKLI